MSAGKKERKSKRKAKARTATSTAGQRVYSFGAGTAEGDATMKLVLGGKGANLAEMARLGLPVPPGFTISTDVCAAYWDAGGNLPDGLWQEVEQHVAQMERDLGGRFGQGSDPVLVSVRSGAAISMPGMMETVLNVGLNEETRDALAAKTGNRRMAYDSHRRLIQMFARVVLDLDIREYEQALDALKRRRGVLDDTELDADDLAELLTTYREIFSDRAGRPFPEDPHEQLRMAVEAVFRSWNADRAIKYRSINRIRDLRGTAVNVQAMVFGNMGDTSATGVCFTRDPSTGRDVFYGEFLRNAQGEDVVAGIRTPQPIARMKRVLPAPYAELVRVKDLLERHYGDLQDMEFTVQEGRLWMLQTRTGKRTAAAAVRIAVDLVEEGRLTQDEALLRVDPAVIDQLLHPSFDKRAAREVLGKGLPASPGAASGQIVFDAVTAEEWAADMKRVILVRDETSPEDIGGMHASVGILTARGGMTSHAAVVARGMGKCCVAGCGAARIDEHERTLVMGDKTLREGDWLSLDGSSGEVMLGEVPTAKPRLSKYFRKLMEWADARRTLAVRTNADTPHDARVARTFGAEGIGLCRTEHMFFDEERIVAVRQMILAEDREGREAALAKLLPMQRKDFEQIFRAMDGLPVTVRLLDPPLHEFLPATDKAFDETAAALGVGVEQVRQRAETLRETNPMMGHRGCRLGISHPEIYAMQARAVAEAAIRVAARGVDVRPEIMVPLVGHVNELTKLEGLVRSVIADTVAAAGKVKTRRVKARAATKKATKPKDVPFLVGTMIEIPRAALTADAVAGPAEFFSFGTNDLTQMTFGFSRDDINSFLPDYVGQGVLPGDPFQSIDVDGVGQLVRIAIERGRTTRPDLKIGICGEHGGDPDSVGFCHDVGMNYVSCSPYRVPIARLAAAQAEIRSPRSAAPKGKPGKRKGGKKKKQKKKGS